MLMCILLTTVPLLQYALILSWVFPLLPSFLTFLCLTRRSSTVNNLSLDFFCLVPLFLYLTNSHSYIFSATTHFLIYLFFSSNYFYLLFLILPQCLISVYSIYSFYHSLYFSSESEYTVNGSSKGHLNWRKFSSLQVEEENEWSQRIISDQGA